MAHVVDDSVAGPRAAVKGARAALVLLLLINLFNYIDRQVLASAVRMLISQRLVRELCPACRVWTAPDTDTREFFSLCGRGVSPPAQVAMPSEKGCPHCEEGFVGRMGIFEVMRVDATVRAWLTEGTPERELRAALAKSGFIRMRDDACTKVIAGSIWIDDAVRALGMEEC